MGTGLFWRRGHRISGNVLRAGSDETNDDGRDGRIEARSGAAGPKVRGEDLVTEWRVCSGVSETTAGRKRIHDRATHGRQLEELDAEESRGLGAQSCRRCGECE